MLATFTKNLCQMEVNVPYVDPMGKVVLISESPGQMTLDWRIISMIMGEFVLAHQSLKHKDLRHNPFFQTTITNLGQVDLIRNLNQFEQIVVVGLESLPYRSMYGIFTYMKTFRNQPNVGKYTSPMDLMGYTEFVFEICMRWFRIAVSTSSKVNKKWSPDVRSTQRWPQTKRLHKAWPKPPGKSDHTISHSLKQS